MKGELEHRAEHWGAELAFTERSWERGLVRVPAACYSGLIGVVSSTQQAHCAEAGGRRGGEGMEGELREKDHKRDACGTEGQGGYRVARLRVTISGLSHWLAFLGPG